MASSDYYLYALDSTGQLLWKFKTGSHLWSKPVFLNDVIYQTSMDKKLYAISASNGNLLWSTDLGSASLGSPFIDNNGIIYASTLGKNVIAIDSATHAVLWKYQTADSIWSGLEEKEGVLYFGDLSGNFTALDIASQKPVWQYKVTGSIVSNPLLLDDGIYFTSENGALTSLDYNGKVIFSQPLSEKLYAPPIKPNGYILVGFTDEEDKIFSAINPNGTVAWSFQTPQ